uniref:AMMECR1 domain-containing protein n=1 Tax=Dunaliella tertiolecta TaxID=3047 RepID=A0A7S3QL45_DUNTE|mmetsp:Transcript_5971/g.15875  ORF Transcript_5971/g.15875 Transcript_5971/m.15875 type:complete len:223 (-) Transcript_5971:746-1414(-)
MRDYGNSSQLYQAGPEHALFAFSVLDAFLNNDDHDEVPGFENVNTALFVTWNMNHRLRGCIGTLEPRMLHKALKDYALTSAVRDSRFSPIRLKDLPHLECKVSLLSCFENAANWEDWQVGKHGIIIEFVDPQLNCVRTATFLPDVPPEQGWDVVQTIDALIRKSGCESRPNAALRNSLQVVRYQSTIYSMSYAEYMAAKGLKAGISNGGLDGRVDLTAAALN